MKLITFTIFLVLVLLTSASMAGWQTQTSGVTDNLQSIYFINETTGWVVGANGRILFTTNGGMVWAQQVSNTTQVLLTVDFPSPLSGYAAGSNGIVVKTTNAGAGWTTGTIPGISTINAIDFINDVTGYACGSEGKVAKTTNGGTSWVVTTLSAFDLNTLKAFDANLVIAAGTSGTIFKTTNGGNNWTQQITGSNNYISSIVFSDMNNGYFTTLGLIEEVYRTSNGGNNWLAVTSPGNTGGLSELAIVTSNIVYGAGPSGKIRITTNSGMTWDTQPSGDTTLFFLSIFMVNTNVGYIAGNGGKILKTGDGGGIGIKQISSSVPKGYELSQNYPNPFNPVTNITFSLPKTGIVKLAVYDVLGKETAVLINNEALGIGTYNVDFNASQLSSGIYLYRIEAGDYKETKKMILTK
ncbi:MAG: T9SS C-terminal target domain-containing protein [Ignavibacteriae bacterium]|nr:MAG: T9SS C-terminal target domain-containing protein [Ignavibacteriota bacterium]